MDDFKLENVDSEDLGDTLLRLEKSFGIKYADNTFKDAKTFGDICNAIESHLTFEHKDDCTTQQAFYKVRQAISQTQNIDERNIDLQTGLIDIFPRSSRRRDIKRLEQILGFSIGILTIKNWLGCALAIGFLLSFLSFFFDWQIAITGLTFFAFTGWVVNKFSKELTVSTVRQLTQVISREHYSLVRRHSKTVNRNEIQKIIQDVFIADYDIDRQHLTKDATLGWT
jgi:hypothetical protein